MKTSRTVAPRSFGLRALTRTAATSDLSVNWGYDTVPHTPSRPRLVAETRRRRVHSLIEEPTPSNGPRMPVCSSCSRPLPIFCRRRQSCQISTRATGSSCSRSWRTRSWRLRKSCCTARCLVDVPCVCQSRSLTSLWIRVAHVAAYSCRKEVHSRVGGWRY